MGINRLFLSFLNKLDTCCLVFLLIPNNLQNNLFSLSEWKIIFVIGILFLNLDMVYTIAPFAPDLNSMLSSSYFYSHPLQLKEPLP